VNREAGPRGDLVAVRAGLSRRGQALRRAAAIEARTVQVPLGRVVGRGDEDARKALERIRCPYAIKDKQGKLVTTLCF